MPYWEWKLNQELNGESTFNKDEKYQKLYKEYLKNEYRGQDKISKLQT
jgi:hypothetical protein